MPRASESSVLCLAAHWNARGLRYKAAGRSRAALRCYQKALALLSNTPVLDRDAFATLFHNLGGAAHALGEFAAGESFARAGLRIRLAGPADAEAVARDLIALAALIDGQRRFDEAEELYLSGLAILRRVPRIDAFEIAVALGGLGCQYAERGDHSASVRLLTRAAELKASCRGPDDSSLLLTRRNLAFARESLFHR